MRADAELSLSDLAEQARVSPTTLYRIETDRMPNPRWRTLRRLARVCGYDIKFVKRIR